MELPQLPDGLELVRTTDVFNNSTAPSGLRKAHRVADGVWGRLVIHSGDVVFVFEDAPDEPIAVGAGGSVVIPPARYHHVDLDGPATFAVEFYRAPQDAVPTPGEESTGLRND
ncbi:MAG: DUF1971 domain-containing protein [Microthrixaceae bacterium]